MRFVVYDDETLEPITVINLPFTDRDMNERMSQRGYRWRVSVPEPLDFSRATEPMPTLQKARIVDLEFEPFVRNSRRHGKQEAWFCFTQATELAMLLNPAWLPGQSNAIGYLMDQNDALTRMLMMAMTL